MTVAMTKPKPKAMVYVQMVRSRPRRKGELPGPWRTTVVHSGAFMPRDKEDIRQIRQRIDDWNLQDKADEHALFRMPLSAMTQVHPK